MPRIQDVFLNCSIYVYRTARDAAEGTRSGGSGFLVAVSGNDGKGTHVYAVTNSHLVAKGFHVIRLNTRDGGFDVMENDASHWVHHDHADVAVLPLRIQGRHRYDAVAISDGVFINHERISGKGMGPGEETFTVGRFINHEGRQRNKPAVRFGCISMMADPGEPVDCGGGRSEEAFLVETRTIGGYSGSPVFVFIPPFSLRPEQDDARNDTQFRGPWLLGVCFGHIPGDVRKETGISEPPGMMCVTPAWKLYELLHGDDLKNDRAAVERASSGAK